MDKKKRKYIIDELIDTFIDAGKISIDLRQKGLIKEIKDDKTPVTNGDLEVDKMLASKIKNLTPKFPIVSEESSLNREINNLKDFWLIDPIDGTYDYVNNKDEFTINAALILNKKPELGIILAPAKNRLFFTYGINESFELSNGKLVKLNCEKKTNINEIKAVSYSDNLKPIIKSYHDKFGVTNYTKMKSSLKFCVIAASEYDIYISEPRASEWDIAAGHAILNNAGGIVKDFENKEILYGKKGFKNPSLILLRSERL
tara:strand:+ start:684 stop:1457 length:774 start_codon:yes stop_codon:yes gene_type:complete